jgi:hypothetical protein
VGDDELYPISAMQAPTRFHRLSARVLNVRWICCRPMEVHRPPANSPVPGRRDSMIDPLRTIN